MKKRILSTILLFVFFSGAAACRISHLPYDPSLDTSGYIEETEPVTEARTPEELSLERHLGEKTAFADDLYSINFRQMITGFQRVLYADYRDTRMLLTLLSNNGLIAAEYDFLYDKWRIASLPIKAARFFYLDENGEQVLLGFEEKYLRFCGKDRYVYCYEDALAFYDQDFQPLYQETGTYENPVFGDGWFAFLKDNAVNVIFPNGETCSWSSLMHEIQSAELSGPQSLILKCTDLYQNPTMISLDFVTGDQTESGILKETDSFSMGGKATAGTKMLRVLSTGEENGLSTVGIFAPDGKDGGEIRQFDAGEQVLRFTDNGMITKVPQEFGFELRLYENGMTKPAATLMLQGMKENPDKISDLLPLGDGFVLLDSYGEEETGFYIWKPECGTAEQQEETPAESTGEADDGSHGNTGKATDGGVGSPGKTADGSTEKLFENPNETGLRRLGNLTFYNEKQYPDADWIYTKNCGSGIGFYVNENGVSRDYPDYLAVPCANLSEGMETVGALEKMLDKMPKGFLEEVIAGFDGLDICICDEIRGKNAESEILTAAAFTVMMENRMVIVVSRKYVAPETNLAHELMHVIDRALAKRRSSVRPFAEWESLNPEGFHYFMSYQDAMGNDVTDKLYPRFTPADEKALENPDIVWFADAYSKTYPMEDRARLFEYLCSGDAPEMFCYLSTHVREKVQYLCEELRASFSSLAAGSEIIWEELPKAWEEEPKVPESGASDENGADPTNETAPQTEMKNAG